VLLIYSTSKFPESDFLLFYFYTPKTKQTVQRNKRSSLIRTGTKPSRARNRNQQPKFHPTPKLPYKEKNKIKKKTVLQHASGNFALKMN